MNLDNLTRHLNRALDILFTRHQERTAIGVIFGVALSSLAKMFAPFLAKYNDIINLSTLETYQWLFFGIFLVHLPSIFNFMLHRPVLDEQITSILSIIEKGDFTPFEKKQKYETVLNHMTNKIFSREQLNEELGKLSKQISSKET